MVVFDVGPFGRLGRFGGIMPEREVAGLHLDQFLHRQRIAADPVVALDALTRQHSTFTKQDVARFVNRHTDGAEQFADVLAKVEASPELVRLGVDGRGRERFSTRAMVAAEQRMEGAAAELAGKQFTAVG